MNKFYSSKNSNVAFVVAEIHEPLQHVADCVDHRAVKFPMLGNGPNNPQDEAWSTDGKGLHTVTFLITPDKKIVKTYSGYMKFFYDDLVKTVQEYSK